MTWTTIKNRITDAVVSALVRITSFLVNLGQINETPTCSSSWVSTSQTTFSILPVVLIVIIGSLIMLLVSSSTGTPVSSPQIIEEVEALGIPHQAAISAQATIIDVGHKVRKYDLR